MKLKGDIGMPGLKFYIVGGYIKIDKAAYLEEMREADSCLKQILEWKSTNAAGDGQQQVSGMDKDGAVTIDFAYDVHKELGQPAAELLCKLKGKYGDAVRGRVCCRWMEGSSMSNFVIDLDSDCNA